MDIELNLLVRYTITLFIPIVYLYMVATYVYSRSSHLKLAKLLAAFALSAAVAYSLDALRIFLPLHYSELLHPYIISYMMIVGFALAVHMLFIIVKPLASLRAKWFVPFIYSLTILLVISTYLEFNLFEPPPYQKSDGWIYLGESELIFTDVYMSLIYLLLATVLSVLGSIHATTKGLKRFFAVLIASLTLGTISILGVNLNLYDISYFIPPTPGLFISLVVATMFFFLILNIDIMPSTARKYSALMESSPTPIIHLNEKGEIIEMNAMANLVYSMKLKTSFKNYFGFDRSPARFKELVNELKTNHHIKGFEVRYFDKGDQPNYVLIDAAKIKLGQQYQYYVMLHDVTNQMRNTKLNEYYAYHDSLTGIHNRVYFEKQVKAILAKMKPTEKAVFILSDLNFFKQINDTYGHQVGDEILIEVTKRLEETLLKPNCLARLGGDEFVIFIENIQSHAQIERMMQDVRAHFKRNPYRSGENIIEIVPSFGMAFTDVVGTNYEALYHEADLTMYLDKRAIKEIYDEIII